MIWLIGIAAIVLVVGLRGLYLHRLRYHFETVVPGRLYRSGVLSYRGLRWAHRRYGIKTVVSLVSTQEVGMTREHQQEERFCRENKVRLEHIPLEPGAIPDTQQIQQFLQVVGAPQNLPLLIHCKQGVARTNMMLTTYFRDHLNWDNTTILEKLPWFKHDHRKRRYDRIRHFILNYGRQDQH
jgi:protein tyrosine phosphatase (PTP) superfamily phosphohydrolase (DUF442 family)